MKLIPKHLNSTGKISIVPTKYYEIDKSKDFADRGIQLVKSLNLQVLSQIDRKNTLDKKRKRDTITDIVGLLDKLWKAGAFKGVKDRNGNQLTYKLAVDGIYGKLTKQAELNLHKSKVNHKLLVIENRVIDDLDFATARTPVDKPKNTNLGRAIYLYYPNFKGGVSNAIKIGNTDIGEIVGNTLGFSTVPVGHAAAILTSPEGDSFYYEYGRYDGIKNVPDKYGVSTFGHVRQTKKGGNWRKKILPKRKSEETDSAYVARILNTLPDTHTGAYQIMSFPNVDVKKAIKWVETEANNPNRKEYGVGNTCANGACSAILPFITGTKEYHPIQKYDVRGYSPEALAWSELPMSTGDYARRIRTLANKVTIMNR